MKIVINIPEDEYQNILRTGKASFCTVNAIEAGTILPKGHGDLIDRDVAYKEFDKACLSWEGGLLNYIPTVISADK